MAGSLPALVRRPFRIRFAYLPLSVLALCAAVPPAAAPAPAPVVVTGLVDDNAHYGTAVSPKLSAGGWPLPVRSGILSSVKVSANVARGIKNPAFPELYGSQWVDGDLSLQPERALPADAGGQLRVRAGLTLFARIDNATDAAYDSALGYPGLPRSAVAGARFAFGG